MTCLTCAHWNLRDHTSMKKFGFGTCSFKRPPHFTFYGPIHTCNQHRPADPRAIAKRKEILK